MTEIGVNKWRITRFAMMMMINFVLASIFASAKNSEMIDDVAVVTGFGDESGVGYFMKLANYLFQTDGSGYHHTWPVSFYLFIYYII